MYCRLFLLLLVNLSLSAYELAVLAMFRDESRYLKEWVDYHRFMGVEHFFLYNDHSKDNWQEVLQEYIDAGIVDVTDWDDASGDAYNYTRQPAIYRDGIKRAIGNTKWLAIIDLDEFIVPMKDGSIVEALNKNYPADTHAIYINWRNFGTGGITVPEGESILYHLTACSMVGHPNNKVGKCIVKPEYVNRETIWTPHHFDLVEGSSYYDGSAKRLAIEDPSFEFGEKQGTRFLRVNHYVLRDEYFFWNFRYRRTGDKVLLKEHYESYCLAKDYAIQKFVARLYPNGLLQNRPPEWNVFPHE